MGLKLKMEIDKAISAIDKIEADVEKAIFESYVQEGKYLADLTRNRSEEESWYDQTGNLRSSIGYVVSKNGVVKSISDFSDGTEGSKKGEEVAKDVALESPGWALNLVAGMEYAEYVERIEGKNVLASARAKMIEDVPTIARRIKERIEKGK